MNGKPTSGTIFPYTEYPKIELPANHTKFKIQGWIARLSYNDNGKLMLIINKRAPEYYGPSNYLNLSYGDNGYVFNHGEADDGITQMLYDFTHADLTESSDTELTLDNYQKLLEQFKKTDVLKVADVDRKRFDAFRSYDRTNMFGHLEHFSLIHFCDSHIIRFADNISTCAIDSHWNCEYDPETNKVISVYGDLRYLRIIELLKLINEYIKYQVHCIGCNQKIDRWDYQEHFVICAIEKIGELTRTVEFKDGVIERLMKKVPRDANE